MIAFFLFTINLIRQKVKWGKDILFCKVFGSDESEFMKLL